MRIVLISIVVFLMSLLLLPIASNGQNNINDFYGLWQVYDLSATNKELSEREKNKADGFQIHPVIGDRLHITAEAVYYRYANGKIKVADNDYKVDSDGKLSIFKNNKFDDDFWFSYLRIYLKKDSDNKITMLYAGTGKHQPDTLTVYLRKQ